MYNGSPFPCQYYFCVNWFVNIWQNVFRILVMAANFFIHITTTTWSPTTLQIWGKIRTPLKYSSNKHIQNLMQKNLHSLFTWGNQRLYFWILVLVHNISIYPPLHAVHLQETTLSLEAEGSAVITLVTETLAADCVSNLASAACNQSWIILMSSTLLPFSVNFSFATHDKLLLHKKYSQENIMVQL
jgi:hypothetical protein